MVCMMTLSAPPAPTVMRMSSAVKGRAVSIDNSSATAARVSTCPALGM